MKIDKKLLDELLIKALKNPRLRQNLDLRTSSADTSQRMLNALLPRTVVPIHRHQDTSETVICLCGKMDEVIYEEVSEYSNDNHDLPHSAEAGDVLKKTTFREVERIRLCPAEARYGCQIPQGAWHTVEVLEPSVIFESKDGSFVEIPQIPS